MPTVLVDSGLAAALGVAVGATRRAGIDVDVATELSRRVPIDVEAAVYFCCVEALQNAAKHSGARRVDLRARMSDGELSFDVTDDGAGFDPTAVVRQSGLANLGERLSVLGGIVTIESAVGRGTSVRGRVPCLAAAEASR